ncbi:hypothetical protein LSAT2_031272 [Lamellibrachia satsuma]|nr:hypothetical protein LSAT2_031272 [Lamellibrachia satsuma]
MPCRAVPYRVVPCRAVPCRAVPSRAVPSRAESSRAVPCHGAALGPQGCYRDKDSDRDLPHEVPVSDMNPDQCIQACRTANYAYAGVQAGTRCFCGDSFGKYGTAQKCDVRCADMTSPLSTWCGGLGANFVYYINGGYGAWGFAEPNNKEVPQRCSVVDVTVNEKFADERCFKERPFICDIPRATCAGKDGYASVNGRCYYLDSTPCTWYEAKQRCVLRGGSLVEIRNSRVHDDVKTVLRQSRSSAAQFWIGLTRGSWNWSTADSFLYTNWALDEPDSDSDRCVGVVLTSVDGLNKTHNFGWADVSCDSINYAICERRATVEISRTSTTTTKSTVPTTTTTTTVRLSTTRTQKPAVMTTTTSELPVTSTKTNQQSIATTKTATTTSATRATTTTTTRKPETTNAGMSSDSSTTTRHPVKVTTAEALESTSSRGHETTSMWATTATVVSSTVKVTHEALSTSNTSQLTLGVLIFVTLCCVVLVVFLVVFVCFGRGRKKVAPQCLDARPLATVPNGAHTSGYRDGSNVKITHCDHQAAIFRNDPHKIYTVNAYPDGDDFFDVL